VRQGGRRRPGGPQPDRAGLRRPDRAAHPGLAAAHQPGPVRRPPRRLVHGDRAVRAPPAGGRAVTEERVRATAGPEVVRTETAGTPWRRYTTLLRQLDEVRAAEESRTAARREANAAMTAEVTRLEPVLAEQGGQISDLARRLGLRAPRLTPAAADGVTEP